MNLKRFMRTSMAWSQSDTLCADSRPFVPNDTRGQAARQSDELTAAVVESPLVYQALVDPKK
jgi:hypothetical protein